MKFNKVVTSITVIGIILGAVAVVYEHNRYSNGIINFKVNNQKVNCKGIKDLKNYIENNTKVYIDSLDITPSVKIEANTTIIDNISFMDYIKLENSNIEINTEVINVDINKLKSILEDYNCNQSKSTDAKIQNNGTTYEIVTEVLGKQVDIPKILKDIQNDYSVINNIDLNDYIIEPDITSEDLQSLVEEANSYINWTVNYNQDIEFKSNIQYVSIEGTTVNIDSSFIKEIVKELEKVYDTAGKGFNFIDKDGNDIEILGGTYGNIMNSAEEKAYLISLFENAQSEYNRTPIMKQELPEEIGNTYLEVSIQEQHMWHFDDGQLCCETDIVTGDANKKRDTPTGVYFISEKINGKYLTGDTYKTWVNKWMRLTNSGVGLHDAYWRGSFGNKIYKGNGSHGCINLPKKYAYNLYEEVYRKMPVIIY